MVGLMSSMDISFVKQTLRLGKEFKLQDLHPIFISEKRTTKSGWQTCNLQPDANLVSDDAPSSQSKGSASITAKKCTNRTEVHGWPIIYSPRSEV